MGNRRQPPPLRRHCSPSQFPPASFNCPPSPLACCVSCLASLRSCDMTHIRSQHENKFDRQMRLWGSHGQAALESAHVCILNSGATAAETLKNLVLPNVGRFTLVDDAALTPADCGNNFFVSDDALGTSRAECVVRWMAEMNSDVKGTAHHTNIEQLIATNLPYFRQFDLIIASQLSHRSLLTLADYLYPLNKPLIALHTIGLLGYARLQIAEHRIVESHPSNDRYDLYIHPTQLSLWPELQQYVDSFLLRDRPAAFQPTMEDTAAVTADSGDILPPTKEDDPSFVSATANATTDPQHSPSKYLNGNGLDGEEHAHIPYIVLLAQHIRRWVDSHGSPPTTYEQKRSFKQQLIDDSWDYASETNYGEAVEFAHRAYERPSLDRNTQSVLDELQSRPVTATSDPYWLVVEGIRRFIANEGRGFAVPVSVDIPDMHSKTEWYVQLKRIFKARSERDVAAVLSHVRSVVRELGLEGKEGAIGLTDEYVAYVVKNVRSLRVVRTSAMSEEYGTAPSELPATLKSLLEEADYEALDKPPPAEGEWQPPNPPLVQWYIALRAILAYESNHNHYPGLLTDTEVTEVEAATGDPGDEATEWREEAKEVVAAGKELWGRLGLDGDLDEDCCVELTRAGGCEPHVIASFMGGVGAQVALKVLLKQYVPINNTLLYNGIHCSSATWKL